MEKSQRGADRAPLRLSVRRQWRSNAIICLVCALFVVGLVLLSHPEVPRLIRVGWLTKLELALGDMLSQKRGGGDVEESLVFIGIDDASLDVLDILDEDEVLASEQLDAMSFGYPFPRSVHAALAQRLLDAGARLIVTRSSGIESPRANRAARTRSRLSATALSGRPTTVNVGAPMPARWACTSTASASTP